MIKQLILLINFVGLFFYQLIFSGDVDVVQKIPTTLTQGKEALVEITISKENVIGFAKVQQELPEGFTAEPVETKEATFSFKDNKVKFIWMSFPEEKEFTISYKLIPNLTTIGTFKVGGKFSFIDESERKNIDIPEANFTVKAGELVAEETTPEVTEVLAVNESSNDTVLTNKDNAIIINCKRDVELLEDGKFKITVAIEKKGIEGFAKITEKIPAGFTAIEGESAGGVFSFKKDEAKILWMAAPEDEKYTINYTIIADGTATNGTYSLGGNYAYIDKDVVTKYDMESTSFDLDIKPLIAEETTVVEPEIEALTTPEQPVAEPVENVTENATEKEEIAPVKTVTKVKEAVLADNNEAATANNVVTSTPNPEHNIAYKVQVGAGHKTVPASYFKTKFNLKDKIATINHEGWIKYLVGSYNEYNLARDKRNVVRNNVKTAFVTAYNSGTRITVQEALMISRQKWYK